jgi:beta-carotene 15,15'-dioxygenase
MLRAPSRAKGIAFGIPPGTRRTLVRWILWPSWVFVGSLALLFAASLDVPVVLQYLPFALSLVLFGLPHGAVDHLAVPRLLGHKATAGLAAAVGLLYLVLGGLCMALWFFAPVAAFALFIALTWLHWGGGDLHALLAFVAPEGDAAPGRASRVLALLARGGLPMLVPLLAFPETYRAVAASLTGLFGPAVVPAWVFGPTFRLATGALLAALVLASLVLALRVGGRLFRAYALETGLLAVYFALVPPVLAVGLYLCLWHAPRHVARLALLDKESAGSLSAGRVVPALRRFARDAAPLTLAALALLAGLYLVTPGAGASPSTLLALYLVLISALTLPHVVVVSWMDAKQGLWRRGEASG